MSRVVASYEDYQEENWIDNLRLRVASLAKRMMIVLNK